MSCAGANKILLIYYTGTYNTRYITRLIEKKLTSAGYAVTSLEVTADLKPADVSGYEFIGLGYPIYAFNSPLPFNRYLKKLRIPRGQKYFIYKNSGETFALNNASSRIIKRRMKRGKAELCGEYHFVMPYNIHFAFDEAFVREILAYDEKLAEVLASDVKNGRKEIIGSNFIYNLASAIISVQKLGGPVNSFFYKIDEQKCLRCNKCAEECPENNISLCDGKIRFGHKCAMCMRCSFFCPANAIKIGMLEGWKVNGGYDLEAAADRGAPENPYITEASKGFYKCFIKTFRYIDKRYDELTAEKRRHVTESGNPTEPT